MGQGPILTGGRRRLRRAAVSPGRNAGESAGGDLSGLRPAKCYPIDSPSRSAFHGKRQAMSKLSDSQRQSILKRVQAIDRQLQNPRLTIEQCDTLRKERESLRKTLMHDRASP
jgi:hypothetical protein